MAGKEKLEEYDERLIRWQQLRISQLSYTNNLILTLTLGMLAFSVSKIGLRIPDNFSLFFLISSSFSSLLLSLLIGIILTINRLCDFRITTKIIRFEKRKYELQATYKKLNIPIIKNYIYTLKKKARELGKATWILLYVQLGLFLAGCILSILTIIIQNN
jgi:hypothetical protein